MAFVGFRRAPASSFCRLDERQIDIGNFVKIQCNRIATQEVTKNPLVKRWRRVELFIFYNLQWGGWAVHKISGSHTIEWLAMYGRPEAYREDTK